MKKEIKIVFAMILTVMLVIILLPGAGALGKVNADEIYRISEFEIISDWDFEDAIYEGAIPSAESMNIRFNKNNLSLSDDSGWIATVWEYGINPIMIMWLQALLQEKSIIMKSYLLLSQEQLFRPGLIMKVITRIVLPT